MSTQFCSRSLPWRTEANSTHDFVYTGPLVHNNVLSWIVQWVLTRPYKVIQEISLNNTKRTFGFGSLLIWTEPNAASLHDEVSFSSPSKRIHRRALQRFFFGVFFSASFFFSLDEAAWSCQGLRGDNNLGRRMTPWEWQMKRNHILPRANCTELIHASPRFSPRKQTSALTYSNGRSSLSLDTRPVPKTRAVSESELGKENWVIVLLN